MKMRYSLLTGLAAGYYLGTMSPEQIKANVTSLAGGALHSPGVGGIAEKAKGIVGASTEKLGAIWPF